MTPTAAPATQPDPRGCPCGVSDCRAWLHNNQTAVISDYGEWSAAVRECESRPRVDWQAVCRKLLEGGNQEKRGDK